MAVLLMLMPRSRSMAMKSLVAFLAPRRARTSPASWMAPPYSSSFSVSVVLPASGCCVWAGARARVGGAVSCGERGASLRHTREPPPLLATHRYDGKAAALLDLPVQVDSQREQVHRRGVLVLAAVQRASLFHGLHHRRQGLVHSGSRSGAVLRLAGAAHARHGRAAGTGTPPGPDGTAPTSCRAARRRGSRYSRVRATLAHGLSPSARRAEAGKCVRAMTWIALRDQRRESVLRRKVRLPAPRAVHLALQRCPRALNRAVSRQLTRAGRVVGL